MSDQQMLKGIEDARKIISSVRDTIWAALKGASETSKAETEVACEQIRAELAAFKEEAKFRLLEQRLQMQFDTLRHIATSKLRVLEQLEATEGSAQRQILEFMVSQFEAQERQVLEDAGAPAVVAQQAIEDQKLYRREGKRFVAVGDGADPEE